MPCLDRQSCPHLRRAGVVSAKLVDEPLELPLPLQIAPIHSHIVQGLHTVYERLHEILARSKQKQIIIFCVFITIRSK